MTRPARPGLAAERASGNVQLSATGDGQGTATLRALQQIAGAVAWSSGACAVRRLPSRRAGLTSAKPVSHDEAWAYTI